MNMKKSSEILKVHYLRKVQKYIRIVSMQQRNETFVNLSV